MTETRFRRESISYPCGYRKRCTALLRCYPSENVAVLQHIRTVTISPGARPSSCSISVAPPVNALYPEFRTDLEDAGYTVVSEAR